MSKGMKILFTLSLFVNLLLGGAVAGHVYKNWRDRPWSEMRKELSPETRHMIARSFMQGRKDMEEPMKKLKEARHKLSEILKAENFDANAFMEQSKAMAAADQDVALKRAAILQGLAAKLPPEERGKMARRFAGDLRHAGPGGFGGRKRNPAFDDDAPGAERMKRFWQERYGKDGGDPAEPPPELPEGEGRVPSLAE